MKEFFNKETIAELKSIIYVIIFALAIRLLIFEPFYIPTTSMYDNLKVGDYLIGTKYNYGYSNNSLPYSPNLFSGRIFSFEPTRGDIIIFKAKNTGRDERFIKRLIGLPGDKVQITNGDLYINGTKAQREYIEDIVNEKGDIFGKFTEILPNGKKYTILRLKIYDTYYEQGPANNSPAFYIPEGKYFFLGDNRDQSADSRFEMGFVDNQELIAKARMIFFSTATNLTTLPTISIPIALLVLLYLLYSEVKKTTLEKSAPEKIEIEKTRKLPINIQTCIYLLSLVFILYLFKLDLIEQICNIWPWLKSIRFDRIFTTL